MYIYIPINNPNSITIDVLSSSVYITKNKLAYYKNKTSVNYDDAEGHCKVYLPPFVIKELKQTNNSTVWIRCFKSDNLDIASFQNFE